MNGPFFEKRHSDRRGRRACALAGTAGTDVGYVRAHAPAGFLTGRHYFLKLSRAAGLFSLVFLTFLIFLMDSSCTVSGVLGEMRMLGLHIVLGPL